MVGVMKAEGRKEPRSHEGAGDGGAQEGVAVVEGGIEFIAKAFAMEGGSTGEGGEVEACSLGFPVLVIAAFDLLGEGLEVFSGLGGVGREDVGLVANLGGNDELPEFSLLGLGEGQLEA